MKYYALQGKSLSVKGKFIQRLLQGEAEDKMLAYKGKKGLLFSDVILEEFIEEEYRHGSSQLVEEGMRGIRTFSSGEKRKALLEYLLNKKPEFLILDSPFDCLDAQSVVDLKKRLEEHSKEIPFIQVFKKKEDLLSFTTDILVIENEKVTKEFTLEEFLAQDEPRLPAFLSIPSSPVKHQDIPEVLVEMKNVSIEYQDRAILSNINWKIRKGEFWELTGANGSGKTTLLSMIYGDNPKAYGQQLYLFGNKKGSGESVWEIKKKIGYFSPSVTELFKSTHSVEQMLLSGFMDSIGLYQKPSTKQCAVAREWLKTLGLTGDKNKLFRKLSLLQQRMLLIARAMIKYPPLLILDEPSTSLDEEATLMLAKLINLISEQNETSIIYVSHRPEKNLKPDLVLKLIPSEKGSTAEIVKNRFV